MAVTSDLGVGQQQLVEIVKALSKQSKILILDEPTAALSESEVEQLLKILIDLRAEGLTCVYISHKLDEVFAICDRITVLRDGASIATLETAQTDKTEVIKLMVGRDLGELFPRVVPDTFDPQSNTDFNRREFERDCRQPAAAWLCATSIFRCVPAKFWGWAD